VLIIVSLVPLSKSTLDITFLSNVLLLYRRIFVIWLNFMSQYLVVPVRIWVRIDPPHVPMCRKRRLNGAVLRVRLEKPRTHVTAGVAR
jgi:hypothetical protein